jgi:hypothetical protein
LIDKAQPAASANSATVRPSGLCANTVESLCLSQLEASSKPGLSQLEASYNGFPARFLSLGGDRAPHIEELHRGEIYTLRARQNYTRPRIQGKVSKSRAARVQSRNDGRYLIRIRDRSSFGFGHFNFNASIARTVVVATT